MAGKDTDKTKPVLFVEFDADKGIADIANKDWFFDVEDINQELVSTYTFPDANRHREFLQDAIVVMQGFSRIELRDNIVIVPSDLTEFKRAKVQFQEACMKIDELAELLFAMRCDATTDMLMSHFENDNKLDGFKKSRLECGVVPHG